MHAPRYPSTRANRLVRAALKVVLAALVCGGMLVGMLFAYPRPADTTEPGVFAGDGAELDYCDQPVLNGHGASADDIAKAFTPDCGWERWPMPVLARCTETLAADAVDLRGLWRSDDPAFDHVERIERIEQCGNRTVVTASGIIHDFRTDGTVANGSRDVEPPRCMNTWVAIHWDDGIMKFQPFGLPVTVVTRALQGDQLVWTYPGRGEVRMNRICRVPETHRSNGGRRVR